MPLDFAFYWIFRFQALPVTVYKLGCLWFCFLCAIRILNAKHTTYINNKRRWNYCLLILLKNTYTNRSFICNTHSPTTCLGSIDRTICMSKKNIEYWNIDLGAIFFSLFSLIVCRINLVSWLFAPDTISNSRILIFFQIERIEHNESKIDRVWMCFVSADYNNNNNEIWYHFGSTEFSSSL